MQQTPPPRGSRSAAVPDISVVMPAHDEQRHLPEQLDALAAQDFTGSWEVVLSDNGSRDDTRRIALERRSSFPAPLRVIDSGAAVGAAHARNAGILAARADRLAFCDADDRVTPGWLRAAHAGLDTHDVVGGPLRRLTEPFDPDAERLEFHAVSDDSIMTCNAALRRDVLEKAGGFDGTFSGYGREDHELSVRLWKIGARFGYVEEMEAYYRLETDQRVFIRKVYSSCLADVQVWRRHPDVFPERQSRPYVLREALGLPAHLVVAGRRGGVRRMARVGVSLAAHTRAMVPPQAPLGSPVLLAATQPGREIDAA